ncbi:MAG: NifU family protein [Ignavibacteriae bacterium]|nr:NifU family protein [Ignavibacteriota bacterium]
MPGIENKVNEHLIKLRPYLQEDKGDVEFVRFEEETSVLELRFLGNCKTCPLNIMTLRAGIERYLLARIPEIRRVEAVR